MDKKDWRKRLIAQRQALSAPDRAARTQAVQAVLLDWLMQRHHTCADAVIGAYWPIRGEVDVLPALRRWQALGHGSATPRRIALPVTDPQHHTLYFHQWDSGCTMVADRYGIPTPQGTPALRPTLLVVPCVGYGAGRCRLGYGGGFYDRTLAALRPRPFTVGLALADSFVPDLRPQAHDVALDAIVTDNGVL